MRNIILAILVFFTFKMMSQESTYPKIDSIISQIQRLPITETKNAANLFSNAKKLAREEYNEEAYFNVMTDEIEYASYIGLNEKRLSLSDSLIKFSPSPKFKAEGYLQKGILETQRNRIPSAITLLKKSLIIFEKLNNISKQSQVFKVLGNCAFISEDLGQAKDYYIRSAKLSLQIGDTIPTATTYTNISRVFEATKQLDSAIYYNDKARNISEIAPNQTELKFIVYSNDANYKSELLQFNEAEESLKIAKETAEKIGHPGMIGNIYQMSSIIADRSNNPDQALNDAEKAYDIFNENNLESYSQQTLYIMQEFAYKSKDFKKAYNYLLKYDKVKDSMELLKNSNNLNDLQLKYKTAEKELKISQQEAEITKKENQNKFIALVSIGLALLSTLLFLFFRQRQKTQNQQIVTLENERENIALRSLITGEEKERSRIAKELHDGLGGVLAVSKIHTSKLLLKQPETQELIKINELIDTAAKESRRISHNLLPEILIRKGLDAALTDFITSVKESHLLDASYHSINISMTLSQSFQLSVYRIVQELMNNIIKHSEATEALVQLHQENGKLTITVEDNGKGFSNEQVYEGIGFSNIKSRLSLLKGSFDINSSASNGTSVFIELQLEK
ncbi:ATP-binding protein [Patiriisocius marinus]|uniref:ATP-binding protein n=1 Tax=Patiriisocius marinus TaxID=1397112 RepID=UPI00232EF734|nr:ATP-binding protein [Patiriisocius marinus]